MKNLLKIFSLCFLSAALVSCSNKEKSLDDSGYNAVYTEAIIEVDKSINKHRVIAPKATVNNAWGSSNLVFSMIPGNIAIHNPLNKAEYYKLFSSSARRIIRTPAVYKDTIYVLDDEANLYAYNLNDLSKPKWTKNFLYNKDLAIIGGGITIDNGKIIVTYGSDSVIALTADGKELWHQHLSNISRSTASINGNKVFINTIDNRLYCLDANNGSILWFYQGATENVGTLQSPAAIVYHDQVIYPFSLNEITGIDINNGQTSFQTSIPSYKLSSTNVNDIDITPVISNNNLYISTFSGDLAAINLATNEVEWSLTQAGAADGNAVWSSSDYLYSITKDGLLISVYKVTGTVRWLKDLKELPSEVKQKTGAIFSGPIMINNMLYVISSHGQVLVFSIVNGDLHRTIEIDSKKQYGPPIAVYNSLYSLANDGTLLQLK